MNITAIKNFGELNGALRVLFTLVSVADFNGEIHTDKTSLRKATGVCERTLRDHLFILCRCNIIKWKYCGAAFLNPDFLFKGEPKDKPRAVEAYDKFKSDISA